MPQLVVTFLAVVGLWALIVFTIGPLLVRWASRPSSRRRWR